MGFRFFIADDVEEWMSWPNNELPCSSFHKKDGIYFEVGNMSPSNVQLPVIPKIKPHDAIQTAFKKEPLGEFCQYELCYYVRRCKDVPILTWKLYRKGYDAYVDAISGTLLGCYYLGSYPHPPVKE